MRCRLTTAGPHLLDGLLGGLRVDVDGQHRSALGGEEQRSLPADAGAGTRDQRDLPFETTAHIRSK